MMRRGIIRLQQTGRLFRGLRRWKHQVQAAKCRGRSLSPERRQEIASHAAKQRWYGDFIAMPCPMCAGSKTHHNGTARGKQRWWCRNCRSGYYGETL